MRAPLPPHKSGISNISHPGCAVREHFLCHYFAMTPRCEWRLSETDLTVARFLINLPPYVSIVDWISGSLLPPFIAYFIPFFGITLEEKWVGGGLFFFFYAIVSNPWVSAKATCGERGSNRLHACAPSWRQMHSLKRKKRKRVSLRFCVSDWNKIVLCYCKKGRTCLSNTSSYLYLRSAGIIDILRRSARHRTNIDALARHKSVSLDPGRPISTNGMDCHHISFKLQYIVRKMSARGTFYQ